MKEMNISDEMLSKFLEGKTDEVEEARLLQAMEAEDLSLEDLAAIGEAAKLADTRPLVSPNLAKAEEQIRTALNANASTPSNIFLERRKSRMRVVWAMAASLALIIAVALFVLFRPDSTDPKFAQNNSDSTAVTTTQPKTDQNLAQSAVQQKKTGSNHQPAEETDNGTADSDGASYTSQTLEKQYARTQTANKLTVTKPGKSNYAVLCKNLEKTFDFEWESENVQSLQFTVKDAQGKTIVSFSDPTAKRYFLKYRDIYPNQKVSWSLTATFADGTQQTRVGQIQIDYKVK